MSMLSDEEKQEIAEEFARYPSKRAACVEALKVAQRSRGWIDDDTLKEVAAFLEMTPAEVDSIATCYNLIFRRRVGRHVILLCDSVSCWIMGYERIREDLKSRLGVGFGETTEDGCFTLLPIVCLGMCDHAPAMMIDHESYGDLTPEKLGALLDEKSR
jgi:NADH-quinone oxidoreductase subunit E